MGRGRKSRAWGSVVFAIVGGACVRVQGEQNDGHVIGVVTGGGGLEDIDASLGSPSGLEAGQDPPADADPPTDSASGASPPDSSLDDTGASSTTGSGSGASSRSTSGSGAASSATANSATTSSSGNGLGGSTGGITLSIGGNVPLHDIAWSIQGPSTYSGVVATGDASAIEWVIGGIAEGSGYSLTVTALDAAGDPCDGTSDTFDIVAGQTSTAHLLITCRSTAGTAPTDIETSAFESR